MEAQRDFAEVPPFHATLARRVSGDSAVFDEFPEHDGEDWVHLQEFWYRDQGGWRRLLDAYGRLLNAYVGPVSAEDLGRLLDALAAGKPLPQITSEDT